MGAAGCGAGNCSDCMKKEKNNETYPCLAGMRERER